MDLKTIFTKPVDRPIEGVIKADDEASLRLEIEEYVLTNEVAKRIESFLDAYNNYEFANGVWVSGFFGSGKSHLLKMLAILLENRQIEGTSALDLFIPKCGENEILRGDLKRAVAIPSKSILFNIDQKADIISKTQIDALLAVFLKVFDETCGYYGKQPYIAQFERELDKDNILEQFIREFESAAGKSWEWGRTRPARIAEQADIAYNKVTGQRQKGVLDKYRDDYRLSIEDFADHVQEYIETQPPDFRLNFFVDEVGQYIAENVKLMTNLQTIAESLATKCRGRAWVIVTAQEDMATVVGEMGKQQGNDFSKIQARFANRMKLTSADVAEVIQKRLLTKTEEGVQLLSDIYHAQSNNFKTLFDFADGSQTYRNYQDRDHFIHCYPFIPYQFALFQSAIQNLSQHNAFEGKHSSVGERSMLGVFQQVAIQIGNHEIGQLATFDLMFEGIRAALKSNIQRAVIQAEKHLDSPFAIRVLKSLFLVKYIKEFKPTLRNLCVLMLDGFNQDIPALKKRVGEALNLLEQQTYVQRNAELYEYLTDEEKDVEQDIKTTEVDSSDVAAELERLVFDHVIKHRKIRYEENGYDYPFSRKLDDRLHGREYELAIHVISPFSDAIDNANMLAAKSVGAPTELLVVMPPDERLVRDLLMYKRTEKYIRQNISIAQRDDIKRILSDKGFQNRDRYEELKRRTSSLAGKAKICLAGTVLDIGGEDGQTRVIKGFHDLVARTYPNLRMLRGVSYSEDKIKLILQDKGATLIGNDATALIESEQEVLSFIQSNNRKGVRTTLKSLIEEFERKPYGWHFAAVICNLANLCARGKVEVRSDGNLLEEGNLERALRNTQVHGNLILELQLEFTASQIRSLKEFFEDFFDTPCGINEAKAIGKEVGVGFQELRDKLAVIAAQSPQYPFVDALNPVLDKLKEISGKPYAWYLSELSKQEKTLLDMKESIINPIQRFMGGSQKEIYDLARNLVKNQESNFSYIDGNEFTQVVENLKATDCFKGNRMQQVKTLLDALTQKLTARINAEVANAKDVAATLKDRLQGEPTFNSLSDEHKEQLTRPFEDLKATLERQSLIAVIRENLRRFQENEYPKLLARLSVKRDAGSGGQGKTKQSGTAEETADYTLVAFQSLNVPFGSPWLANEADVDKYIESMRKTLLDEIRKGKRIQI